MSLSSWLCSCQPSRNQCDMDQHVMSRHFRTRSDVTVQRRWQYRTRRTTSRWTHSRPAISHWRRNYIAKASYHLAATEVRRLLRTHPERATDMPDDKLRPLLQVHAGQVNGHSAAGLDQGWQCSGIFGICSLNLRPARHWKNDSWPV